MASDISAQIGVDGERQFRDSVKAIDAEIKALNAEMRQAVTEFAGMDDAERDSTKQVELLNNQIDKQKDKLALLESQYEKQTSELDRLAEELEKAKKEFGENSEEAGKAQNAYNKQATECQKLRTQIADTNTKIAESTNKIKEMDDELDESRGKLSVFGDTLKGVLGAEAIKAGFSALVDGAKAAVGGVKEIVDAYADYEQLVGGVETLFDNTENLERYKNLLRDMGKTEKEIQADLADYKDPVKTVMDNAAAAYKTAGLSANEYMETVTAMAAALNASTGDLEVSADMADMAIRDMSDNANKMGSSMESIQNAYNGFAKQNYTMLDNLKLGYGGTKEEMQRLLEDAEAISGVTYDIRSYADVVDAIHVVQTELGITGTTAKEAEATISGSMAMLQSAFENLMAGLGNPDVDLEELVNNVVDAFESVVTNIQPVLENIAQSLPTAIGSMMEAVTPLLPQLLQMGIEVLAQVAIGILKSLPEIAKSAPQIVSTLVGAVAQLLPQVVTTGQELIKAASNGIISLIQIMKERAADIVTNLISGIQELLRELAAVGVQMLKTITDELSNGLSQIKDIGRNMVSGLWNGIKERSTWLLSQVRGWCNSILEEIKSFFDINSPSRVMRDEVGEMLARGMATGIDNGTEYAVDSMRQLGESIMQVAPGITSQMDIQTNANGILAEGLVNGMAAIQGRENINLSVKLVLDNTREIAEAVFNDLLDVSKQRGVSLA